jgi:outer membrane protein insertion porin family
MPVCFLCLVWLLTGCRSTRHLREDEYLLRRNNLEIRSDKGITRKAELHDQLRSLILQKPNSYALGFIPFRLWLYNVRHKDIPRDTPAVASSRQISEPPVLYDSTLQRRSAQNMKSQLFNNGYFYARVRDTVRLKKKKAFVTYHVETGTNYLINRVIPDIDDSLVASFVRESMVLTELKSNRPFSYQLLEAERVRITSMLRNKGFFKFSQENITFQIDTLDKSYFKDIENPFESAINFLTLQRQRKKPTLDITIVIRTEDPDAYRQYLIGKVFVFPDFVDRSDISDSSMIQKDLAGVTFRYHDYYVREPVLLKHIYLIEGKLFSQNNYDQTITKLNELGLFQYVRLYLIEDTTVKRVKTLRCYVLLNPTRKYDVSTNFEVSSGSTYSLGSAISLGFRNRNMFRGGNQFSATVSGGVETGYSPQKADDVLHRFYLLSRNFGFNTSIVFPKFLAPINQARISRSNLPRTIFAVGINLLDRVNYFTMTNTSASMTYNWRETPTKTWDISPAFINIMRLPNVTDSFQRLLNANQFLRNTYKPNFIEGENIYFTFTDQGRPSARTGYSYIRVGVEEAGGVMSGINAIGRTASNTFNFQYAQYVKFDFDARRYFLFRDAMAAFRFYGGVGVPYDKSSALPYVKQYFVGGAYSIRGWRVRNLGPGGSVPDLQNINFIDRTGDIKLELNGEYRFPMLQLFAGAIGLNGALFTDAGNIWLFKADPEYENGSLTWRRFGHDIAVSSGAGARLDIGGIFTLRFDAAFPLKKPYVDGNSGWVIDRIGFGSRQWRDENLILNIAIGYPF